MPKTLPGLAANAAFFIDFDGTLAPIAERPDLVVVEPGIVPMLKDLRRRFEGAVAVITGRPLARIDALLEPLILPVAAEHGAVRRDAAGAVHEDRDGADDVAIVTARLEPLVAAHPGLMLERKTASVALHYRARPDLAEACALAVKKAIEDLPALTVLPGKMVFEVRGRSVTKGTAVEAFLAETPFRGRMPVYVGDDFTDEYAFAAINAAGGVSIKIGEGDTIAKYRTERNAWLEWCAAQAASREGVR